MIDARSSLGSRLKQEPRADGRLPYTQGSESRASSEMDETLFCGKGQTPALILCINTSLHEANLMHIIWKRLL